MHFSANYLRVIARNRQQGLEKVTAEQQTRVGYIQTTTDSETIAAINSSPFCSIRTTQNWSVHAAPLEIQDLEPDRYSIFISEAVYGLGNTTLYLVAKLSNAH